MGAIWAIGVYILNVLDVTPASVELPGAGAKATLNATFTGRGPLGASTSNPAVATVAPGMNADTSVVTAVASGEAVVTVADRRNNTFAVRVSVGRT